MPGTDRAPLTAGMPASPTVHASYAIGPVWRVAVCVGLVCAVAWAQEADVEPAAKPSYGARIPTSDGLDSLLKRAARLRADEQHYDGMRLLQQVSEQLGDELIYQHDGMYRSGRVVAQRAIADWASEEPKALEAYRVLTDAIVEGMLHDNALSARDERKLREVVDRYFLSRHGDEAALALGCLLIDRQAYGEAASVLSKVVGPRSTYPDPSVDPRAVWSRLGLAAASIGDSSRAAEAVAALKRADGSSRWIEVIQQRLAAPGATQPGANRWLGHGPMPSLPSAPGGGEQRADRWVLSWQAQAGRAQVDPAIALSVGRGASEGERQEMIKRWRAQPWRPATMAQVVGDRLLFRAGLELVSIDRTTGQLQWATWTTHIRPTTDTIRAMRAMRRLDRDDRPRGDDEVLLFGDRVSQQFSVSPDGRRAYLILPPTNDGRSVSDGQVARIGLGHSAPPGNQLVAVELATGRKVWKRDVRSQHDEDLGSFHRVPTQFIAAPLVLGDRLLTVIDDQGEFDLVALRARDGEVLWRQEMGQVKADDLSPRTPTMLATDGATAYISTGRGAIFAADGYTGNIRWALPYRRDGFNLVKGNHRQKEYKLRLYPTWAENRVAIVGDTLVVTAADTEALMFIDRRTGRKRAAIAGNKDGLSAEQMDYVIATMDARIFIGGANAVHCFAVDRPKHLWTATWEQALGAKACTGRAALTPDAIFVPVDRHIVRLDPQTGEHLGEPVEVRTADDQPLGNLYSDGERLLDVAMERVRALAGRPKQSPPDAAMPPEQ